MVEILRPKGQMVEVQGIKVTGYVTLLGRQIVLEVDEESFRKVLETGYVSQHEKFDDLPEGQGTDEEQLYINFGSICMVLKKKN